MTQIFHEMAMLIDERDGFEPVVIHDNRTRSAS